MTHQQPNRREAIPRALILAMEDFINEPPRSYDVEPIEVRDYRHQAYRVWSPVRDAILALEATPDPASSVAEHRGFDAAISAIRAWAAGFMDLSTRDRLEAVAADLERNRATILGALPDPVQPEPVGDASDLVWHLEAASDLNRRHPYSTTELQNLCRHAAQALRATPSVAGVGDARRIASAVMGWVTPHLKHIVSFNTLVEAIEGALLTTPPQQSAMHEGADHMGFDDEQCSGGMPS